MSKIRRSGRNRGAYSRKGVVVGLGSLEVALLAIADAQASLGMTDGQLESASGIPRGAMNRLRQGQGRMVSVGKITEFFELKLEGR